LSLRCLVKTRKTQSPGTDQIPTELIKAGGRTIRSEINKFTNSIWNKQDLTEEWKEPIILPIYNQEDKTQCSNYRVISLLSTIYKILSNIRLSRLTPNAEEIIGDHQCRFQSNGSTTDHIFCIRQILHKKNGNTMKQRISYLQSSRNTMIQLGGRSCIIFLLSLGSPRNW